jgi:Pentapeptide repeats (9 copies)
MLGLGANLYRATFGNDANFSGAAFGNGADLSGATFGQKAKLRGWSSDERTKFRTALVEGPLSNFWSEDRKANFVKQTEAGGGGGGPDRFSLIKFAGARFLGDVDFSGRRFDDIADFSL